MMFWRGEVFWITCATIWSLFTWVGTSVLYLKYYCAAEVIVSLKIMCYYIVGCKNLWVSCWCIYGGLESCCSNIYGLMILQNCISWVWQCLNVKRVMSSRKLKRTFLIFVICGLVFNVMVFYFMVKPCKIVCNLCCSLSWNHTLVKISPQLR